MLGPHVSKLDAHRGQRLVLAVGYFEFSSDRLKLREASHVLGRSLWSHPRTALRGVSNEQNATKRSIDGKEE
jgi:hypothetical protein